MKRTLVFGFAMFFKKKNPFFMYYYCILPYRRLSSTRQFGHLLSDRHIFGEGAATSTKDMMSSFAAEVLITYNVIV